MPGKVSMIEIPFTEIPRGRVYGPVYRHKWVSARQPVLRQCVAPTITWLLTLDGRRVGCCGKCGKIVRPEDQHAVPYSKVIEVVCFT